MDKNGNLFLKGENYTSHVATHATTSFVSSPLALDENVLPYQQNEYYPT